MMVRFSATIEPREAAHLRPHPQHAGIFGPPEECAQWPALLASVRKHGIIEPLGIKADGTILSGHLRYAAAVELKLATVPVRVAAPFACYREELKFIIRSNADRRQLTKPEIAFAFKHGGVKRKKGRPATRAKAALIATLAPTGPCVPDDQAKRVEEEAAKYARDLREVLDLYQRLDRVLTRRPLKSVLGPTEHHDYGDLLRDIAIRAWREIEAVRGPTQAGKQMTLAIIHGGHS